MKKQKVLVTGMNGQLGSCLQEIAESNDYSEYYFIFTDSTILDITDAKVVEDFFFSNSFDFCINCAAYTAVDQAEDEVEKAFLVNADGVKNLAKACKEQDATLIHISTDYVFDGEKPSAYLPTDEVNPINVYGKSKLKGEENALQENEKTIIIRTSWVYSEYGNNFLLTMRRLFKDKTEINVVDDQRGRPTDAFKLAKYIVSEVLPENPKQYGIRHYASEAEMSWYEFALRIKEEEQSDITIYPIPSSAYPTKAKRPKNSVLQQKGKY